MRLPTFRIRTLVVVVAISGVLCLMAVATLRWVRERELAQRRATSPLFTIPLSGGRQRVYAGTDFSLTVPIDMACAEYQGIDSYVGGCTSDLIQLKFDYGPFGDSFQSLESEPGFHEEKLTIDGRPARLMIVRRSPDSEDENYLVALHVPKGYLSLSAQCKGLREVQIVREIASSITFP